MTSFSCLSTPQTERIFRAIRDIELLLSEWHQPTWRRQQPEAPRAPAEAESGAPFAEIAPIDCADCGAAMPADQAVAW